MRLLTKEEKLEYHFLMQFVTWKKVDLKITKPPKDFIKA